MYDDVGSTGCCIRAPLHACKYVVVNTTYAHVLRIFQWSRVDINCTSSLCVALAAT